MVNEDPDGIFKRGRGPIGFLELGCLSVGEKKKGNCLAFGEKEKEGGGRFLLAGNPEEGDDGGIFGGADVEAVQGVLEGSELMDILHIGGPDLAPTLRMGAVFVELHTCPAEVTFTGFALNDSFEKRGELKSMKKGRKGKKGVWRLTCI